MRILFGLVLGGMLVLGGCTKRAKVSPSSLVIVSGEGMRVDRSDVSEPLPPAPPGSIPVDRRFRAAILAAIANKLSAEQSAAAANQELDRLAAGARREGKISSACWLHLQGVWVCPP